MEVYWVTDVKTLLVNGLLTMYIHLLLVCSETHCFFFLNGYLLFIYITLISGRDGFINQTRRISLCRCHRKMTLHDTKYACIINYYI